MQCSDVTNQVPHPPHWHTVGDGVHAYAGGECMGFPGLTPVCACYTKRVGDPVPNQPLRFCPVHQPRLYELHRRNHANDAAIEELKDLLVWECARQGDVTTVVENYYRGLARAILASDWLAAHTAAAKREGARGIRFRVEVACDGYAHLMDEDVPSDESDLAAYQQGAHDAAEAIRAVLIEGGA